jgi:hypothetical protein
MCHDCVISSFLWQAVDWHAIVYCGVVNVVYAVLPADGFRRMASGGWLRADSWAV